MKFFLFKRFSMAMEDTEGKHMQRMNFCIILLLWMLKVEYWILVYCTILYWMIISFLIHKLTVRSVFSLFMYSALCHILYIFLGDCTVTVQVPCSSLVLTVLQLYIINIQWLKNISAHFTQKHLARITSLVITAVIYW